MYNVSMRGMSIVVLLRSAALGAVYKTRLDVF